MTITCVNCGGKGYVLTTGYDGFKRPVACRGCNGTGQQRVLSSSVRGQFDALRATPSRV